MDESTEMYYKQMLRARRRASEEDSTPFTPPSVHEIVDYMEDHGAIVKLQADDTMSIHWPPGTGFYA